MGKQPLQELRELHHVSLWCSTYGINTLFDMIFDWLPSGSWVGWVLADLLPHLSPLFQIIFSSLQGCARHHLSSPDSRGLGSRSYLVHSGYEFLLSNSNLPPKAKLWNIIWDSKSLPKINIFYWTLTHGKILTGENLKKQSFHGPFICGLCFQALETISHLFFQCPFALNVWSLVLANLYPLINKASSPAHFFRTGSLFTEVL